MPTLSRLALSLIAICALAAPARADRLAPDSDDELQVVRTDPNEPEPFFSTWSFANSFYYTGGFGTALQPIPARYATYIVLEAPTYCAPRVKNLEVSAYDQLYPTFFLRNQISGAYTQGIWQITPPGFGPILADGVLMAIPSTRNIPCRINIYSVQY